MPRHLQKEVEHLKKRILELCANVEKHVALATRAVEEQDEKQAREIIEADIAIDQMEVEIEEECLKILALHQPVAVDLRVIIAILKINGDLERIGDLAAAIAERAVFLANKEIPLDELDFCRMAECVMAMLRKSVDSLVKMETDLAYEVWRADDEVDQINREMYRRVEKVAERGKADMQTLIHLVSVSRALERIGDHATNIAEDVIYMITGDIVRHNVAKHIKQHNKPGESA